MKPGIKFLLTGVVFGILGFLFIMWGLSDFAILFDWPPILIYIIPTIVAGIILVSCMSLYFIAQKKEALLNPKRQLNCSQCGSSISLDTKFCEKCGSENVYRLEALDKLTKMEQENQERQTKKFRSYSSRKQYEMDLKLLNAQARKIKIRKLQLTIGSKKEDKIRWAKEQYEKGVSIQEIAESLGESFISVKQFIDSDTKLE